jgi:PIN domain nuclease of toxin-antitoxin system
MRLLLDTHVLLWWHDQSTRLTDTAYGVINDLGNDVFISVVNGWEIQIKAQLGKLTLSKPLRVLLQEEQATNGFRVLPVTLEHIYALDSFPLHHRAPVWSKYSNSLSTGGYASPIGSASRRVKKLKTRFVAVLLTQTSSCIQTTPRRFWAFVPQRALSLPLLLDLYGFEDVLKHL